MRSLLLISKSVLIEGVRRKEIYAIVLFSLILIAGVMSVDFFEIRGLTKFYREMALAIMSIATAITVIVLSCRQLPREFEKKTIYPLMAKPISRMIFLSGKLLGVLLSAAFCFLLFMIVYVAGTLYLGGTIPWMHFAEYIYLQMLMMTVLSTLGFFLSLVMNLDAAVTLGVIFYFTSSVFTTGITFIYEFMGLGGKTVLVVLNYILPQLTLFDLSGKILHSVQWPPLGWTTMAALTLYALLFSGVYYLFAILAFRRREL